MITNFVRWVLTHKATVAQLTLLTMFALFIINFASGNAIGFIQIESTAGTKNSAIYVSNDAKTTKAWQWGIVIIPRDTKSIIVTSGNNLKTQAAIDIPWYGVLTKKITLKKDTNADKIAYRSTQASTCTSYMPSFDQLAFYNCANPAALLRYEAPATGNWSTKNVANLYYSTDPVRPYLGGVIGIAYVARSDVRPVGDIIVTTENGTTRSFDAPIEIPKEDLARTRIFTDRNDPNNNRFVIVAENGDIFVGTPNLGGKVDYHYIAPPQDYSTFNNETLCVLTADKLFCYRGPTGFGDTPENFNFNTVARSQILTYAYDGGGENIANINANFIAINGFYVNRDGGMFIRKDGALSYLAKTNHEYAPIQIAQNVTTAVGGERLHYVHNNGVFSVDQSDPTTSHQVFYSSKIAPKAMYSIDDRVFFIGTHTGNESVTYAYQLNSTPNDTPGKRLIDLVPIDKSENYDAYASDLVGDRIRVSLNLTKNPSPEKFGVEFAQKKEKILNYFASYGITLGESQISFEY